MVFILNKIMLEFFKKKKISFKLPDCLHSAQIYFNFFHQQKEKNKNKKTKTFVD